MALRCRMALLRGRGAPGRERRSVPGERRSGRYCAGLIRAKPAMLEQYMQLHDRTWPEVMARMHTCNMRAQGSSSGYTTR